MSPPTPTKKPETAAKQWLLEPDNMTAKEQVIELLDELNMICKPHPDGDWQLWLDFFTIPDVRPCPLCDGRLVQRDGRFGEFLGCSGYPVCRYSE